MQENGKKSLHAIIKFNSGGKANLKRKKKHQSSNIKRGEMDCLYVKELKRVLCKKDVNQK